VTARLQGVLSAGRFSLRDRLVGSLKGARLRVWKQNLAGYAGDFIEFDGTLKAGDTGTIIEGTLKYRLQTKIQFGGLLVISAGLLAAGLMRHIHGTDSQLLALGGFITILTLAWIYASRRTRHLQIRFIEEQFVELTAD
jgi:hypothetical protein